MLLDFRELTGEHSGDNLCSIVWDTLETYGIEDRVHINSIRLRIGLANIPISDIGARRPTRQCI